LGIRYVGEETSIDLALHFGNLEGLKRATLEELEAIPDIGNVVAKSVYNWFRNKSNLSFVDKLLKSGVKIIFPQKIEKKLKGKKFVFTGSLKNMVREEAKNKVRVMGGEVSSSVSKETDFLVCGDSPGSKKEKAEKLGVKILQEKEFLKIIS